MTALVSESRQEDFSAPPPKKKWLQEYIEQDSSNSPSPTPSITNSLSTEAREFVRLFDNGTDQMLNKNLKELSENKHNKGKMTLSQEVIGGVVQGVLDQFQTFFEATSPNQVFKTEQPEEKESERVMTESLGNRLSPKNPTEKMVMERPQLAQHHITPVVQSVISQFLNGSLDDFSGSRKRSHKHLNCRHKGDGAAARSRSVIRYKSRERQEAHREERERVEQAVHLVDTSPRPLPPSPPLLPPLPEQDENEALNLSLPKPVPKVTFASRDRCYTTDHPSVKSFQPSKSEVISNLELGLSTSPPSVSPCLSLPVIRHTSARSSPVSFSPPSTPHLSYPALPLPTSSPPPLEIIKKAEQHAVPLLPPRSAISTSFPVIKPLPLVVAPISEPGVYHSPPKFTVSYPPQQPPPPQELPPVPRQPVSTLPSRSVRERQENLSKEEIKRTSSSTREVHNRLEKNRRAHLKMCFDELAIECNLDPKKTSNLTVIRSAYKYTMTLKRKERENERSMASLVKQKIALQQRLEEMKRECPNFKPELDAE